MNSVMDEIDDVQQIELSPETRAVLEQELRNMIQQVSSAFGMMLSVSVGNLIRQLQIANDDLERRLQAGDVQGFRPTELRE